MTRIEDLIAPLRGKYTFVEDIGDSFDSVFAEANSAKLSKMSAVQLFDPLLLEQHLRDAAGSLERILAYRREADDLMAAAFGRVLELEARRAIGAAQEAVELQRAKDNKERSKIANRYAVDETQRKKLVAAHAASGSALNFAERRGRVLDHLKQELDHLSARMLAVRSGSREVYGLELDEVPQDLDEMIRWTRVAFVELDARIAGTYETLILVALAQEFVGQREKLMTDAAFKEQRDKGPWRWTLSERHLGLPDGCTARLRGLGVLWDSKVHLKDENKANVRFRMKCATPSSNAQQRREILLSAPCYSAGNSLQYISSPTIHNLDPLGEWELSVVGGGIGREPSALQLPAQFVDDVKLALRVVVIPGADAVRAASSDIAENSALERSTGE